MGSVKLEAALHLIDRSARYGSLFKGDEWQTGLSSASDQLSDRTTLERLTRNFEQHILEVINPNKPCTHLYGMKRIGMLLKMLEWPGFSPRVGDPAYLSKENRPNTRYMTIQPNEYRDRLVLPDAGAFCNLTGDAEPSDR